MFKELKGWLQVPVIIKSYPERDEYGDVADPTEHPAKCYLEHKANEILTREGETYVSLTTMYFDVPNAKYFLGDRTDIITEMKFDDEVKRVVQPVRSHVFMYDRTGQLHLIKIYV